MYLFAMAGIPQKHDPGGKVRLAISRDVKSSAVFGGPDDCYRYRLIRTWDETKPHAMFIMMNRAPRTRWWTIPPWRNAAALRGHGATAASTSATLSRTAPSTKSA